MHQPVQSTVKLPQRLIEELGLKDEYSGSQRDRNGPGNRKEKRKAARIQRKTGNQLSRIGISEGNVKFNSHAIVRNSASGSRSQAHHSHNDRAATEPLNPKSILKKTESKGQAEKDKESHNLHSRSSSPTPVLPQKSTRGVFSEDAEIAALEKALGVKNDKLLPKSFTEDGLDTLLDGLGDSQADELAFGSKRKRTESEAWLERKRRNAQTSITKAQNGHDQRSLRIEDNSTVQNIYNMNHSTSSDTKDTDSLGSSSEDSLKPDRPARSHRENPYVAPTTELSTKAYQKYLLPSLRIQTFSKLEDLSSLHRQIQGILNRISEANFISMLGEVERLYRDNPRQHVSTSLLDLLIGLICDSASLQDTFIILHAGFIAAIYKIIGIDFGAQAIQRIYEEFIARYPSGMNEFKVNKISVNLISLLAELYNYRVIDSTLIYDFIRLSLEDLTEGSVELVMRIMRNSSSQLRQDGASSLKDIMHLLESRTAKIGEGNLSVRTKFMIETMNDLKNNRVKIGVAASTIASEHRIRMKKTLGSLNNKNTRAREPLRIGINDIKNSDRRGKWWLVGASFKDEETTSIDLEQNDQEHNSEKELELSVSNSSDLARLAREQRMNTDVRRSIFVAIMSATDFKDAFLRLQKLRLKKTQEVQIPKVLIHCAGAEKVYNPFYSLVSRRVCSDRKMKMAFQFSLWDLFKQMGEDREGREEEVGKEDEGILELRNIVNLAKMFGFLLAEDGLGIGVLKTLSFAFLRPQTKTFVEILLITTILHSQHGSENKRDEKALMKIFVKSQDTPHLARGLQYFLKEVVSRTDIAGTPRDCKTVKWGCKVACDALKMIVSSVVLSENNMSI